MEIPVETTEPSYRGEGNRQHSRPEGMRAPPGVSGSGTLEPSNAEQERSYPAAKSGKDWAYQAGRLKSRGTGRRSEGAVLPVKARSKTRWREGTLWSRRRGDKREDVPETANNPDVKARQLDCSAIGVSQVCSKSVEYDEDSYNRNEALVKGWIAMGSERHAGGSDFGVRRFLWARGAE